ncbi:uncharacterized protein LOC142179244 [Nicotiana tabacum]|uniref:Uncharacterized protein LOC142179244 n=1 Tax=Nicotiana tabacum TaxID=4097 RepID=A0AC58U6H2_TOBAC
MGTENYNLWSRSIRIGLFTKNKIRFIDGTCKKENFGQNLHDQWERCNAFVLSWIMNVVTKELYSTVVYGSSVCNEGLAPVSVYYSKLKDLWDEYDAMTPTPLCPCPESKIFLEHIQQQRLVQF